MNMQSLADISVVWLSRQNIYFFPFESCSVLFWQNSFVGHKPTLTIYIVFRGKELDSVPAFPAEQDLRHPPDDDRGRVPAQLEPQPGTRQPAAEERLGRDRCRKRQFTG